MKIDVSETNNQWIHSNAKFLDQIIRLCTEYNMKGNYGGNLPLEHIIRLFNSSLIEMKRLQKEVEELQTKIIELKKSR